tara:strand:- start:671 stop:877 length:207 start_codon:yes stop_codon:yes gene_type:complete
MKRKVKTVRVDLSYEEWWPLNRFAASQDKANPSIRRVVKEQLMPLINRLKKEYSEENPNATKSSDDVH